MLGEQAFLRGERNWTVIHTLLTLKKKIEKRNKKHWICLTHRQFLERRETELLNRHCINTNKEDGKRNKKALKMPDEQAILREERNWTFIQTLHKHKWRKYKEKSKALKFSDEQAILRKERNWNLYRHFINTNKEAEKRRKKHWKCLMNMQFLERRETEIMIQTF